MEILLQQLHGLGNQELNLSSVLKMSYRGDINLSELSRFRFCTNGEDGMVFMGIQKCGKADEGSYTCHLTNRFGKREHKFKLFVSSKSEKECLSLLSMQN